jgi:uncharacterized membrane protein YphA (DoxX/SURF4 family)
MDEPKKPTKKVHRTIASVFIILIALFFIFTSYFSLSHNPGAVNQMEGMGFNNNTITLVGVLELISGLLLLLPFTRSVGLLMASAYLGAAIATHLEHDQLTMSALPATVLAVLWIAASMRHPQVLTACRGK